MHCSPIEVKEKFAVHLRSLLQEWQEGKYGCFSGYIPGTGSTCIDDILKKAKSGE